VFGLLAPVFGLIVLGYVIGRSSYLSNAASQVLAEFGFKVAMPALLFRAASSFSPLPASPMFLLIAYFGAGALVWLAAALVTTVALNRPRSDAPAVAMASCFGNTVMLGVPLSITAFGAEAAAPLAILISVDTPLLWLVANAHAEWSLRRGAGVSWNTVRTVLRDLAGNPIVMSVVLGFSWRLTGLGLQAELDKLIALVAQAAVPTALVALGLTLSKFQIRGEGATVAAIASFKLLLFPILVGLFAYLLSLPPAWAGVALVCAAMPTGANAYLFAVKYDRAVGSVSSAVLITTALAWFTLMLLFGALSSDRP